MAPLAGRAEKGKLLANMNCAGVRYIVPLRQLLSIKTMVERNAVESIAFLHDVDARLLSAGLGSGLALPPRWRPGPALDKG